MTPEHWLNIATHGLALEAAARVRAEYLAHLEDALEAGESAEAVLREWGDPHTANRELSKAHLTTREARYLPAGYAPTWAGLGRALGEDAVPLLLFALTALAELRSGETAITLALLLAIVAAALLRWLVLSRQMLAARGRATLYWLLSFPTVLMAMSCAVLASRGAEGWHEAGRLLWERGWTGLLIVAYLLYHFSRLLTALSAARKAEAQL
ncbi:hypothetical protein Deipr_0550 [Deinococcus proteolyticus MRP]|uniref:Uncharacterized protein n=1 Tax=Deinococcus proteolyticus (strain ATCC 35074 / DSM 20540 / JCM 6276 / NBRC 101906 / NCIMB 13154 / VKM Ac-1939 / CCM 2703 / MRP) TaxID=693977 RepID=F0RKM2_DEIPM|nr:hypothetical protein [Deinococcus proteolyticus]ADY25712.1 hypothetical protein Deipr_0550 [Deinococcus proteolyticus MRP]